MDNQISSKDIKTICKQYNVVFNNYKYIHSGSSNINFLLDCNDEKYILKCMPKKCFSNDFVNIQNWLNEILIHNKIKFTANLKVGNNYIYETKKNYFQLRRYIENINCFNFSSIEQIKEAANNLAEIHSIDIGENHSALFLFKNWILCDITSEIIELEKIFKRYFGTGVSSKMITWYSKLLQSDKFYFYTKKQFPTSIIHGDYHGGNLLFDGKKLVNIIDWDTARINPRIYDFAKSLYLLTRNTHGCFDNNIMKMGIFIDSYTNNIKLSYEELMAVPYILEINYIPKPDYIRSFGENEEKIRWYLEWTYNATIMIEKQFKEKYLSLINKIYLRKR